VWARLRQCEPADAIVVRLSSAPARIAESWQAVRAATAGVENAFLAASIGRGVVRCVLPVSAHDEARDLARIPSVSTIFERLPAHLWSELTTSAVGDRLSTNVRRRFDPAHVLNPGILGEEIA
jgi:hypothetical protein